MATKTNHSSFRGIRPGDRVTYVTPQNQTGSGRVVMAFQTHVVLNIGGSHGTPKVVDDGNYVSHKTARRKHE